MNCRHTPFSQPALLFNEFVAVKWALGMRLCQCLETATRWQQTSTGNSLSPKQFLPYHSPTKTKMSCNHAVGYYSVLFET
jgi:hypothetical protein